MEPVSKGPDPTPIPPASADRTELPTGRGPKKACMKQAKIYLSLVAQQGVDRADQWLARFGGSRKVSTDQVKQQASDIQRADPDILKNMETARLQGAQQLKGGGGAAKLGKVIVTIFKVIGVLFAIAALPLTLAILAENYKQGLNGKR